MTNDCFVSQSAPPPLGVGEIHVWFFAHWPDARNSARSQTVREWLARYLDVDTSDVHIDLEPNGKPQVRAGGLHFNISHSGEAMLLGVSRDHAIGVDLEFMRRPRRVVELAQRWFDPAETAMLQTLPETLRQTAFLRLWTCKEAVLKADGRGIADGLHRAAFAMTETGDIERAIDPAWRVNRLEPASGYLGAVAWQGPDVPISTFVYAAR